MTAIPTAKRIRESAPFRKSMSMSSADIYRADELEKLFTQMYPNECPFSFSKTISKALEIALSSIQDAHEPHNTPTRVMPELPATQQTLCLDNQEITRPPAQETSRQVTQKSQVNNQPSRPPKLFGKRKNR